MKSNSEKALVAGVGMTPFLKPGTSPAYDVMGAEAIQLALADAGIDFSAVQQIYAGYVYGDSCSGQRAVYRAGLSGVPIVNVNNNCSTGSTALFLARQAVESGMADCVLAVGFEQMQPGPLPLHHLDRPNPTGVFDDITNKLVDHEGIPRALRFFGGAGLSHMKKYGTRLEDFASVRAKASRHAMNNPLAMFRQELSVDDVMNAQMMWPGVITRLMACPPTSGAAATILVSPDFAKRNGLDPVVRIAAQSMVSDTPITFEADDMIELAGYSMAKRAGQQVYEEAGIGPESIHVVELHDCFAQNEVLVYEGLGLCGEGEASQFIADGDNTYGGRVVTNPSGGLLSKGHPLGATGLAQCYELTHQLRGSAGRRQVDGLHHALQHNLGIGGACVVTLYEKVG